MYLHWFEVFWHESPLRHERCGIQATKYPNLQVVERDCLIYRLNHNFPTSRTTKFDFCRFRKFGAESKKHFYFLQQSCLLIMLQLLNVQQIRCHLCCYERLTNKEVGLLQHGNIWKFCCTANCNGVVNRVILLYNQAFKSLAILLLILTVP